MSNQPLVTYTAEEQTQLANLNNTARILRNISVLLSSGHFEGKEASIIIESQRFLEDLFNQTSYALSSLEQSARQRQAQESVKPTSKAEPVATTTVETPKAEAPKAKKLKEVKNSVAV